MSKKTRKRAQARIVLQQGTPINDGQDIAPVRPRAGPGQVFKDELIDMKSGWAKRFRNVASSPLDLAFYRGKLVLPVDPRVPERDRVYAEDRYSAGQGFHKLWYVLHQTGMRDSTVQGISGFSGLFLTEAKEQAGKRLRSLAERMERKNYLIVAGFCGCEWTHVDSLRQAGAPFDVRAAWPRICEALDDLVYITTRLEGPRACASYPTVAALSPFPSAHEKMPA